MPLLIDGLAVVLIGLDADRPEAWFPDPLGQNPAWFRSGCKLCSSCKDVSSCRGSQSMGIRDTAQRRDGGGSTVFRFSIFSLGRTKTCQSLQTTASFPPRLAAISPLCLAQNSLAPGLLLSFSQHFPSDRKGVDSTVRRDCKSNRV